MSLLNLPVNLWYEIFRVGDIELLFRKLYLLSGKLRGIFYSGNKLINNLWKEVCERNGLFLNPMRPFCFEYFDWQNNNLKLKKIEDKIFNKKENVFVTGGAGVGKTFLLQRIKKKFSELIETRQIETTASTGCAAILIEGKTLHVVGGFGIKNHQHHTIDEIVKGISGETKDALINLDVLIIDEISMISPIYFETFDLVCRNLREEEANKPFGGIQLIVFGDFFQLSPVPEKEIPQLINEKSKNEPKSKSKPVPKSKPKINTSSSSDDLELDPVVIENIKRRYEQLVSTKVKMQKKESEPKPKPELKIEEKPIYCFETKSWIQSFKKENCFILKYIFRQEDRSFSNLLNGIRQGRNIEFFYKKLQERVITNMIPINPYEKKSKEEELTFIKETLFEKESIKPTELTCLRIDVQKKNDEYLKKLIQNGAEAIQMKAFYQFSYSDLCIKTHFELITSMDKLCQIPNEFTLCIGAQVMLTANLEFKKKLVNGSKGIIIGFESRMYKNVMLNDPIVQFDNGEIFTVKPCVYRYGYDLILKKRSGCLENPPKKKIRFRFDFKKKLNESNDYQSDDSDSDDENDHKNENFSDKFCGIEKVFYPLILAWVISIHKSQGMSIKKGIVDLKQAFANGQGYVALSRITDWNGLYLLPFYPNAIKTDSRVKKFYEQLEQK